MKKNVYTTNLFERPRPGQVKGPEIFLREWKPLSGRTFANAPNSSDTKLAGELSKTYKGPFEEVGCSLPFN